MDKQKKLIIKWIEALRSNKYKQGKGCLRSYNNEFCCLGVLCDVYDNTKWHESELKYSWKHGGGYIDDEFLEQIVGCRFENGSNQKWLSYLNDNGYDFACIAQYIEEEILPNFCEKQFF